MIGDLYRRKAVQETDAAARQSLYRQALDSYDLMLKSDATNERALAESAAIRAAKACGWRKNAAFVRRFVTQRYSQ